jgi:hypothetical protein
MSAAAQGWAVGVILLVALAFLARRAWRQVAEARRTRGCGPGCGCG